MTTDGGGWALIGRGRNGWSFAYDGQGNPADGPQHRSPVRRRSRRPRSSTETVNGLMNGGRMDGLTDGLRIRRARNSAGTTWQDVRLYPSNYGPWSWAFGGGIYLNRMCFDGTCSNISSNGTGYGGQSTRTAGMNSTDRRHEHLPGCRTTTGSPASGTARRQRRREQLDQLPVAVHERGPAAPVRAGVHPAAHHRSRRHRRRRCPTRVHRATTVRPMLDDSPVNLPWQVTNLNVGATAACARTCSVSPSTATRSSSAASSARCSTAPAAPKVTQSYLAAFDKNTGEFIPSFTPVINGPVHESKTTPDGKLIVAGEFTSVNGVGDDGPRRAQPDDRRQASPLGPRQVSREQRRRRTSAPWTSRATGSTSAAASPRPRAAGVNPTANGNIARLRLSTDGSRRRRGSRASSTTASGRSTPTPERPRLRGRRVPPAQRRERCPCRVRRSSTPSTARWCPGLQTYKANADTERQQTIMEVGDSVYQGGSQHFLHKYAKSDYSFQRSHLTLRGGDFQSMSYTNGILYASNHSQQLELHRTRTRGRHRRATAGSTRST